MSSASMSTRCLCRLKAITARPMSITPWNFPFWILKTKTQKKHLFNLKPECTKKNMVIFVNQTI